MVVYTQTDRVKHAQNAVVEFLLVNHPLDCPVCDKGGECPLQDISYGWGPGRSRFDEHKRNFPKPIALSPLIAIDRERCILCYRCVRFSQEVAEDDQLDVPRARRPHLRRHVRRAALRRAVLGQRRSSCARSGALTNTVLPVPRAALGHRGRGLGLHALPEPVQRRASRSATSASSECCRATTTPSTTAGSATRAAGATSRSRSEDRVARAARARRRAPAPGDLGARARRGGRGASARPARRRPRSSAARPPTRRATCSSASSARRSARRNVDSRAGGALDARGRAPALAPRPRRRGLPTSTAPAAVLVLETDPINEAPILDLRLRKAVRRFGCRLVIAASAPDRARRRRGGACCASRPAPARRCLRALQKALLESRAAEQADRPASRASPRRRPRAEDASASARPGHARGPRSRRSSPSTRSSASPRSAEVELDGPARRRRAADAGGERRRDLGRAPRPRRARAPARSSALGDLGARARPRRRRGLGPDRDPGRRPTAAACARSAASPALGPGLVDAPSRAGRRARRATPRCARRGRTPSTCCTPIRCASCPGASAGTRRSRKASFVVAHEQFLGESAERTPTSSSRPSPTPRRRAPSRIPTAASSACGPRSGTPARCGSSGRCWSTSRERLGLDVRALT